ncbi:MAG: DsbC family protein [Halieaceae bacterium]|nr:DsbC family protein [Halieaceae bacterium]
MKVTRFITGLMAALLGLASAWVAAEVDPDVEQALRAKLDNPAVGLKVGTVSESQLPGMLEVQFENGPMVYATPDGGFFLVGDLFAVQGDQFVNLAEQRRDKERVAELAEISSDDMIVFPADGETRSHITVFTDATCFYCQKLHQEVPELNKRGVEVRYLAYPRAGVGSDGYRQLATAWCSENPQDTLTKLKNRESVADNVCPGNPISSQFELGQKVGVRGTPAIITETGRMIPGYQSADDMMVSLGLN